MVIGCVRGAAACTRRDGNGSAVEYLGAVQIAQRDTTIEAIVLAVCRGDHDLPIICDPAVATGQYDPLTARAVIRIAIASREGSNAGRGYRNPPGIRDRVAATSAGDCRIRRLVRVDFQ